MIDYNKKLEEFLGIGLDDYPGSDYSPIEEYYPSYSKYPNYRSEKWLNTPIHGLFERIEVITFPYRYNRIMSLSSPNFEPAQMNALKALVNGVVDLYGGDNKGMLWLLEEEIEEILLYQWNGRIWEFDRYEEVHDIFIHFNQTEGLSLTIKETGDLIDF